MKELIGQLNGYWNIHSDIDEHERGLGAYLLATQHRCTTDMSSGCCTMPRNIADPLGISDVNRR